MIEFKNVSIKYINQFFTLDHFNKEFKTNTLLTNDPLNSASAIMRILSKIDTDYSGDVFIYSVNIKDIKDKDLTVAYLPENPELFKNKNIIKNLIFPLLIRKINKKTAITTANTLISQYNLSNYIKNVEKIKIKKLNNSEQKIIALLRAVIRKPKILLIENLFTNLDQAYSQLVLNIINQIKTSTLILAYEEDNTIDFYQDFNIIDLCDTNKKEED